MTEVKDHKLTFARWLPSPNRGGKLILPTVLVVHYTGGVSLEGAVSTLSDARVWGAPDHAGGQLVKLKRRSAHLAIGRTGEVVQLVEFNHVAWHAGESVWRGKSQVNLFSIGIELDNPGPLAREHNARDVEGCSWHAAANRAHSYRAELVLLAKHRSGGPERGWLTYTPEQLMALDRVTHAIVTAYPSIKEGVGHEDIAPGRKTDPGPAFPMEAWRARHFPTAQAQV